VIATRTASTGAREGGASGARSLSILYVGSLARSARSRMMVRALGELGHAVEAVGTDRLDAAGEKVEPTDLAWRVMWRLGRPLDREETNARVLAALERRPFDVLWVTKALVLRPETLEAARRLRPRLRLCFYSEDDMAARHNQSRYFRAGLPRYDVVFTTKSYNLDAAELPALGARRVELIDKCFDRNRHRPLPLSPHERRSLGAPVAFIGTFEGQRARWLAALARSGVDVRVWGTHWRRSWQRVHPRLRVECRALWGEDYVRGICATDVNLGFLRKQNRDLQTDRSVEIPACGGFLLAERTSEHSRLFEEGVEAEFFDDLDELLEKTRYYLEHPAEREAIARAGRERCLSSGYSFHDRLPLMLRIATGDAE